MLYNRNRVTSSNHVISIESWRELDAQSRTRTLRDLKHPFRLHFPIHLPKILCSRSAWSAIHHLSLPCADLAPVRLGARVVLALPSSSRVVLLWLHVCLRRCERQAVVDSLGVLTAREGDRHTVPSSRGLAAVNVS